MPAAIGPFCMMQVLKALTEYVLRLLASSIAADQRANNVTLIAALTICATVLQANAFRCAIFGN